MTNGDIFNFLEKSYFSAKIILYIRVYITWKFKLFKNADSKKKIIYKKSQFRVALTKKTYLFVIMINNKVIEFAKSKIGYSKIYYTWIV